MAGVLDGDLSLSKTASVPKGVCLCARACVRCGLFSSKISGCWCVLAEVKRDYPAIVRWVDYVGATHVGLRVVTACREGAIMEHWRCGDAAVCFWGWLSDDDAVQGERPLTTASRKIARLRERPTLRCSERESLGAIGFVCCER